MKKLLFLVLAVTPFFCRAQTDTAKYKQKEELCLLLVYPSGSSYEAYLDDGHKKAMKEMELKNGQGKAIEFGSMVNVLDYMSQRGWILNTSYPDIIRGIREISVIFKRPL
jgi:hypothetical protein